MFNPKHGHILDSLREYQDSCLWAAFRVDIIGLASLCPVKQHQVDTNGDNFCAPKGVFSVVPADSNRVVYSQFSS